MKKILYAFLLSTFLIGSGLASPEAAEDQLTDVSYAEFSDAVKSPEADALIKLFEDKDQLIKNLETTLPKFVEMIKAILEKPELNDVKKTYFDLVVDMYSLFASYGKILKTITKEQFIKLVALSKNVMDAYAELLKTSTEEQKAKFASLSKDVEKLVEFFNKFSFLIAQKTAEGLLPVID